MVEDNGIGFGKHEIPKLFEPFHRGENSFGFDGTGLGLAIVKHIGLDIKNIDSVILYEPGIAYNYKSAAALEIAKNLGGFFHFGTVFKLIPNGLRNLLYDYIARNRYLWYGKKDSCLLPTEEIKSKFLE